MEKRKDIEEETQSINNEMDIDDSSSGKITFKKQSSSSDIRKPSFNKSVSVRKQIEIRNEGNDMDDKAILKGSKVVMPEYVIGQKKSNKIKRKFDSDKSSDTMEKKSDGKTKPLLQHLFDEDEDEEED